MKIHCLLSWWDERSDWLREMVASIAPLCDTLVAVDGPYALTRADGSSPIEQHEALWSACADYGVELHAHAHDEWHGGEVEKRAFMFEAALRVSDPRDWFLIMDGDQLIRRVDVDEARKQLAACGRYVAEVMYGHRGDVKQDAPFRSMFRALPGLTVERAHYVYTAPVDGEKKYLWFTPLDLRSELGGMPEPAYDLTGHVEIQHRIEPRPEPRRKAQQDYYTDRDRAGLER